MKIEISIQQSWAKLILMLLNILGVIHIAIAQLSINIDNGKGGNSYYEGEVISYRFIIENKSSSSIPFSFSKGFDSRMVTVKIVDVESRTEIYNSGILNDYSPYIKKSEELRDSSYAKPDTLYPNQSTFGYFWVPQTQAGNLSIKSISPLYSNLPENNIFGVFKSSLPYPYIFKPGKYKLTFILLNFPDASDLIQDYYFKVLPVIGRRKVDFDKYITALYQCFNSLNVSDSLTFSKNGIFDNYPYWNILKNEPSTFYSAELVEASNSISMSNFLQVHFKRDIKNDFYIFNNLPQLKNLRKTAYLLIYLELFIGEFCKSPYSDGLISTSNKVQYLQDYLFRIKNLDPVYSKIIKKTAEENGINGLVDYSVRQK